MRVINGARQLQRDKLAGHSAAANGKGVIGKGIQETRSLGFDGAARFAERHGGCVDRIIGGCVDEYCAMAAA